MKKAFKFFLHIFTFCAIAFIVVILSKFNASAAFAYNNIDTPSYNQYYYNSDVTITGWALNSSGVSRADIYVNGHPMGSATSFYNRPDVAKAYSSFNFSNLNSSGFSFKIPKESLSPGTKEADVAFIGNDGSVQWNTVIFNYNCNGQPPIANIDTPYSGQTFYNGNVTISGWALNRTGLARADVYVDGHFSSSISSFFNRSDVANAYSSYNYPNANNSGFSYAISTGSLSSGKHEADIAFIGWDSSVQWKSVVFYVYKAPAYNNIDLPSPGQNFENGDVTISGWALNGSGINRVDMYLNGHYFTSISSFYNRPDVAAAYADFNYPNKNNAGFSYTIPSNALGASAYEADLAFIGNDGSVQWNTVNFTENKRSPQMYVDTPGNGQTFNNTDDIQVIGWALNASGLSRVDLALDGAVINSTTQFFNHAGVGDSTGAYKNADQNGFSFSVPISRISTLGTHAFTVAAYGKDGSSTYRIITIVSQNIENKVTYNISISTLVNDQNQQNGILNRDDSNHYTYIDSNTVNPDILTNSTTDMYQFLNLEWHGGSVTADQLNAVLAGKGTLSSMGQAFIDAANASNVNPIYLVAHARLETGNGTSWLATGKNGSGNFNGYYNMFGICADDADPVNDGNQFAIDHGWNSPYAAIVGGAKWIADHYVNARERLGSSHYDQKTIYEMKWDPYGWTNKGWGSEYATGVSWVHSIAGIIKEYSYLFGNDRLTFNVPQYN